MRSVNGVWPRAAGPSPEKGGARRHARGGADGGDGAEVARLVGDGTLGSVDFEALERAGRDAALGIMSRMVANRLNADRSDTRGSAACRCGADASYVDRRAKTFTTVLGSMTLERAWYHCPACGRGFSPRDRALGLENASLSPAVRRMVGIAAAEMSFGHASAALRELAGLEVGAKQVERHAEALGRDIARDELEVVDPEPPTAKTLHVGLDGTGVPMRKSETAGRLGKQADGSAKTREAKLVTVWSAEGRDKDGSPCRDPGSGSCNGAIESIATRDTDRVPSLFAKRVLRELERRCVDLVARRVVLGDGAPWIWNFADEHLPDAVQIVDVFHAKQHIFDVAKAIYGPGGDLAAQWGKARRDELDQRGADPVIAALRQHVSACDEARKNLDYFTAERMAYPTFRAKRLCVSTGVVEGACKSVIGNRLKRGGMHWTVDGANAIIALRCAIVSNRFDDYWGRQAPNT